MKLTRTALALSAMFVLSASLAADVRTDQKGLVKFEGMLGRMVSIFGGRGDREGVKTAVAVKGDRKASITDTTSQIIDLKEEKIYDLDLKKKSYKVTTFAELRAQMEAARKKVFAGCRKNKLAFLEGATPDKIAASLDEGVRVISGHNPEAAKVGRAHQKRTMPV